VAFRPVKSNVRLAHVARDQILPVGMSSAWRAASRSPASSASPTGSECRADDGTGSHPTVAVAGVSPGESEEHETTRSSKPLALPLDGHHGHYGCRGLMVIRDYSSSLGETPARSRLWRC
jgi:hypothetical protein